VQSIGLEKSWRQERPFGKWKARLSVKGTHLNDKEWDKRILAYSHQPDVMPIRNLLVISPRLDIYPSPDRDDYITELLVPSRVSFAEPLDPVRYPHGEDPDVLGFDLEPTPPEFISAHINDDKTAITSFDLQNMVFNCEQRVGTPIIRNWIDLYGREMTLSLVGELGAAESIYFSLYYDDTNDSHKLTYTCEHCGHATKGITSISTILTDKELGLFPPDYKTLFPSEFEKIENRMRTARIGDAK
jgi:hypothetical protein